jgi:NitT/TauT family transport system substrate-binding protein
MMKTTRDKDFCPLSRRSFIAKTAALGAASIAGISRAGAAEPPPEVTRIRFAKVPVICFAPQLVAEALLRLEGFSEVAYVNVETDIPTTLANRCDMAMFGGPSLLPAIDTGYPLSAIAGLHEGCWELFAHEPVNTMRDLKGRSVAIGQLGGVDHVWLSSMFAYVGIDPKNEIQWVTTKKWKDKMRLYVERKVDAFLAFPPEPQELRANNEGHVIVDTTNDRPWSQYFCCLLGANNEFIERNPVATKRALRAVLKAADICSRDPEWAAQFLVENGYEPRYEVALEVLNSLSYDRWRTDNPADTMRFHSLRLREAGMIKSTPQQIIERGTNFSFLKELKRELKA